MSQQPPCDGVCSAETLRTRNGCHRRPSGMPRVAIGNSDRALSRAGAGTAATIYAVHQHSKGRAANRSSFNGAIRPISLAVRHDLCVRLMSHMPWRAIRGERNNYPNRSTWDAPSAGGQP